MTVQFNLNNNEISKELLDNKFNMILENHGRLVLNDQKSPLPHSEPQRSLGFVQKQPPEVLCKIFLFLKLLQISQENTCLGLSFRPATSLKRDSNTGVFLLNL